MKNLLFIYFILALLSIVACNNDTVVDQYFLLDFEEPQTITKGNFDIEFVDLVEETRCPSTVECIWEGRAVVSLKIVEGIETTYIELATENDVNGTEGLTAIYGNCLIELIEVSPYPTIDIMAPEEDYSLVLEITEL